MYNESLKNKYINERILYNNNVDQVLYGIFNNSEKMEKELDKDLSCFTVSEIIEFYKSLCSTSCLYLNVINGQLKYYTQYCMTNNIVTDGQNHYDEIDIAVLNSCINIGLANASIITRKDLLHMCGSFLNVSDEVLALAVFEGISGKYNLELKYLKKSDINGNIITLYNGRQLEISDKLIELINESCDVYVYNSYAMTGGKGKELIYNSDDDTAIKDLPQTQPSNPERDAMRIRKRIWGKMMKLQQTAGSVAFTIGNLNESGRIEMARKLINNGATIEEALRDKELEYRYGRIQWLSPYIDKYGFKLQAEE